MKIERILMIIGVSALVIIAICAVFIAVETPEKRYSKYEPTIINNPQNTEMNEWLKEFSEDAYKSAVETYKTPEIKGIQEDKIDFESLIEPPKEVVEKGNDILILRANENPSLLESIFT